MNRISYEFEELWDKSNYEYIAKMGEGWKPPKNDWIKKYLHLLPECKGVLELGCGIGMTTQFLVSLGLNVLATDISNKALEYVRKTNEGVKTLQLDLTRALPFEQNSYSLIVADLSLHYFTADKTKEIMYEIRRILKPDGMLVARVNSIEDPTAEEGEKVEENLYLAAGKYRRYFSIADAQEFFGIVGHVFAAPAEVERHAHKKVIDVFVRCNKQK